MLSITDYLMAESIAGISPGVQYDADQRTIDSLHTNLRNAEARAERNFNIGNEWIAYAKRLEQENTQLRSTVATLNRVTAERNGLLKFLDMAVHLLQTQRAGKASRPEFAQLREFALEVAGVHLDGGVYEGLADQPEKRAWLRKVWEALR